MNNTNPLQEAANQLASRGRYGDTMMVHMNPIEVDALAQLSPTGQLTTNPDTGQPEAFLPLLFSCYGCDFNESDCCISNRFWNWNNGGRR